MTGAWLIVKWMGITVLGLYCVLILVAIWRFRAKAARLGSGLYLPIIVGNFISLSVPSIFENVAVTRACFIVAHAIFVVGIVILVRGLAQKQRSFEESSELTAES
jgi:cyanate permease